MPGVAGRVVRLGGDATLTVGGAVEWSAGLYTRYCVQDYLQVLAEQAGEDEEDCDEPRQDSREDDAEHWDSWKDSGGGERPADGSGGDVDCWGGVWDPAQGLNMVMSQWF